MTTKNFATRIFIVVIETQDDPSEIIVAYGDEERANTLAATINSTLRGGFSVAVVKTTELEE